MTFARLAKFLAVLLVAFALWRARAPGAPVHIVILALPGASSDLFTSGEQLTTVARGPITVPPATTGAAFWRRLFASTDDSDRDPGELVPLWSADTGAARVVAMPASLFDAGDPADEVAFVGESAGAVVESEDITSGRLPSPYDRAADAVVAAAATLGRDQWSDWITVEPPPMPQAVPGAGNQQAGQSGKQEEGGRPPAAQFQFARFGDNAYYFSPAYVFRDSPTARRAFLRGKERELRPLVASHAIAVSRRRLDASRDLLEQRGDGRPVVIFDTVTEDAAAVFAPDTTPSAVLEQVRDAIAAEVAQLRKAGTPEEIVIFIGGPTTSRPAETAAWYHIVRLHGVASTEAPPSQPLDFEAARAMLRYVLGVPIEAREKSSIPQELVRLAVIHPRPVSAPAHALPPPARSALSEWSAATLESASGGSGGGH